MNRYRVTVSFEVLAASAEDANASTVKVDAMVATQLPEVVPNEEDGSLVSTTITPAVES